MSRLTFVIPMYKPDLTLLERNIKALVAQSLKDWDAVFVLDGVNQEALSLIHREMKKSPNRYRTLLVANDYDAPLGAPHARNAGASLAVTGSDSDLIIFWDCDCVIEPDAAKGWVDSFDIHPEVGFIYGGYKFLREEGCINSEPWDPWLLRVRNYISTNFPLRKKLLVKWDESLKSLQDWDFWLRVVENSKSLGYDENKVGLFKNGYAWATAFPTLESVSGKGCTAENWLSRVKAVQKNHGIKTPEVCVSALGAHKPDGVMLAKLLGADYQDLPEQKPHEYRTVIQVGFSLHPNLAEIHASIFSNPKTKKILFWTADNIDFIYNSLSFAGIVKYSTLLNGTCTKQFVEDGEARKLMAKAGFNVEVLPAPMTASKTLKWPEQPAFAVDVSNGYSKIFEMLDASLPDLKLDILSGQHKLEDYTGLIHFYEDRTLTSGIKRALLSGRNVISNVQSPFAGFVDDKVSPEEFVKRMVDKIRKVSKLGANTRASTYYQSALSDSKLKEVLCA